ncbi:MAG: PQQ-dependent sugar dehydrogenase [Cyanobacteria bacterium P01_F01_bin.150]
MSALKSNDVPRAISLRRGYANFSSFRLVSFLGVGAISLLAFTGCKTFERSSPSVSAPLSQSSSSSDPAPAESSAPPSATSQERSSQGSVESATSVSNNEVKVTTVMSGLDHPWGMDWLPDGSMLITERSGQLWHVQEGNLPVSIDGLPDILVRGQGGLLDIAIHPQFEQNSWIYISYASGARRANHTRVMRAELRENQLQNVEDIFQVSQLKPEAQHFGSRLTWLPDQTLLISIGDGGNPPVSLDGELIRFQAQSLNSHLGKVLRINDDGSVPSDNPFSQNPDAEPLVWSYGHRNIQGLAYDPVTDRVWASEHGARGGDEINLIEPGQNYGWPLATHSQEYSGGDISPDQSLPGMVDPLVVWTPSIAPSGFMVYRGDRFPQWQGNLFAGGLVSRELQRFEVDDLGNIVGQYFMPIGQRVREVKQGPDGLIYVLTDEDNGQLLRLAP